MWATVVNYEKKIVAKVSFANEFKQVCDRLNVDFDKVVEWDRDLARKFQDKFSLTDYQMLAISFAKYVIIISAPARFIDNKISITLSS